MRVLSGLFGLGVAARNALYDRGALAQHRLANPVISVGNLRVGGTGKTPFVIALGKLLIERGIAFDVLSRGYGRSSSAVELVDAAGTPARFGDEPLLIARSLEVPVVVGASRFEAGRLAEKLFAEAKPAHGQWLHLLDDGFQHRSVARQFDIVLVTESDLKDTLLPFGRLREPLSSLARANVIVIDSEADDRPMQRFAKPIWRMRRKVTVLDGGPAVVFCGVARPERFFHDVLASGTLIKSPVAFGDHHTYCQADIKKLLELRASSGGERFITTEKDLIRLAPWLAQLQPIDAARLEVEIENGEAVLEDILTAIAGRQQSRS